MKKIDELKKKANKIRLLRQQVAERSGVEQMMTPISEKLRAIVNHKIETNKLLFLQELLSGIEKKLSNNDDIVSAIKSQTNALEDKSGMVVVNELKKLLTEVSKLGEKKYFDQKQFDSLFKSGVEKITNLLISQDEVPRETVYQRRGDEKISKVIEKYDGFTLEHTWNYDSNANLINVKTVKK